MHSTFHHNSSSLGIQGGGHNSSNINRNLMTSGGDGGTFPPSNHGDFASAALAANPSCHAGGNPLASLEEDLFFHDDNDMSMGVAPRRHPPAAPSFQQTPSSLGATSESLADALRGFQESIALMSQSQSQSHVNQRPNVAAAAHSALVKPHLCDEIGKVGPSKTAHLPIHVPKRILQQSAAPPKAASVSASSSSIQALPSQAMALVAPVQSLPVDSGKTKKAATGGKKKKGGWRKPSDKPKRPLSAYNIFFQVGTHHSFLLYLLYGLRSCVS